MNSSHKHRLQIWTVFVSLAMSLAATDANTITISSLPDWNGTSSFGPTLGQTGPPDPGAVATYGQTFTVPTGTPYLTTFSIWMENLTSDPLIFGGCVMQWNGQRAIGPILYDSGAISLQNIFRSPVSFSSLNLELTPGQQYVFILSASRYLDGLDRRGALDGMAINAYPGGGVMYLDNGTDTSEWTTDNWITTGSSSWDTVFTADFSSSEPQRPVPEAANTSLLVISAAFLGFEGLRRKHATKSLKPNC